MGNFGISFGFPAGILAEKFGTRVTSVLATLITTTGFVLLWSTRISVAFYADHGWLQYFYFFLAGLCCSDYKQILVTIGIKELNVIM